MGTVQTYRLAMQMEPDNPEVVSSLASLLSRTGRPDEARQLLDTFARNHRTQALPPTPSVSFTAQSPK